MRLYVNVIASKFLVKALDKPLQRGFPFVSALNFFL